MNTVRIGIIGAGAIGRTHIRTMQQEPRCATAGIADPTPAAAEYAQQHGIPYFADHRDLLTQPLEGVIIATPTGLHAALGLDCAARGIPMLVEKPIAATVELAEELATAAEKAGVPLLVGHHRRHNPIVAQAREIVRSGRLGRLISVTALWTLQKPDDYYDIEWRRQPGGGPVLTNLIHDIDTLRFVCGEIESLQAFASNGGRGLPFNDTAAVALRFTNGALGTISMSDAVAAPWAWDLTSGENSSFGHNPENCYLLAGTAGALAVPRLKLWRYGAHTGWGATLSPQNLPFEPADPYARQLGHFLAVIRGSAPVAHAPGSDEPSPRLPSTPRSRLMWRTRRRHPQTGRCRPRSWRASRRAPRWRSGR